MPKFHKGDHVTWNSEAGYVSGKIIKVHTADFDYKGYRHRASPEARNMRSRAIKAIILPPIKRAR